MWNCPRGPELYTPDLDNAIILQLVSRLFQVIDVKGWNITSIGAGITLQVIETLSHY